MKTQWVSFGIGILVFFTAWSVKAQDFQGKAYYYSKSTMELGRWGARLSEAQKKQVMARLKNRLEKTYILTFNKEESVYKEDEKLDVDALSGATDSWGKNFSPGEQYKNIKSKTLVQNQEFYGKVFLVQDALIPIQWTMGAETKQIGGYTCYKATATIPSEQLSWYEFSWSELRAATNEEAPDEVPVTEITAWYTLQIPVSNGPSEYYGLPGLILEVNVGNTTMLCFKVVMNPDEKIEIEAPKRGKEVTKEEYKEIITAKMQEMRENRGRRRPGR
ncbi:GLPGLI family protein [Aquimarina brevivitae]|uniref:GLPGLI family protein n=1 Tax=Aquimarina brevivitae TaxID=323412 RepID=A0A4Q7NUR8_9FLAO|nr:GLPGLI family protein [Aquimarina brevivitae]RZS90598.1 GLPGLI family protein [Aquimarina brevivitae]